MKFYFVLDSSCMLIYDGAPSGAGGCGSSSVVEYNLAKVRVEGSNPFSRSFFQVLRSLKWVSSCACGVSRGVHASMSCIGCSG